jgi:alanine dehydrogenase
LNSVGIPKELKVGERRVGLSPSGVEKLTHASIAVFVEKCAGEKSGFSDQEYLDAGATVVSTPEKVWASAGIIKKVKEPVPAEFLFFKPEQVIFAFLHLASPTARPLVDALLERQVISIGYETVEINQEAPILKPMSIVAGTLAGYFGGLLRCDTQGPSGLREITKTFKATAPSLALNYPNVPAGLHPGNVVVMGGGDVGISAASMSSKMSGRVVVSEIDATKRNKLARHFNENGLDVKIINPDDDKTYVNYLSQADCIVGAVHAVGARAACILDIETLKAVSNKKKKVIIDVAIDQGGNIAESRVGSYEEPLYLDSFGNIRFSVSNMPAICGRGATHALDTASVEFTIALAAGLDHAFSKYPELKLGLNTSKGDLVHKAVRTAHSFD